MREEKYLGKITRVKVGLGGYQDVQLGISFEFEYNKCWGSGDFRGFWDYENIEHTESTQWSEDDRDKAFAATFQFISKLLADAKVSDVNDLVGKPVEVTTDGSRLKSWRILTEVL